MPLLIVSLEPRVVRPVAETVSDSCSLEIATETPIEPDDLADFNARWAVSFDRVTDADVPTELWDPTTELAMRAQVDWYQGEPS